MHILLDGQSVEVQGSASRPYVLKNVGGIFSCSCPGGAFNPYRSSAELADIFATCVVMLLRKSESV